MNNNKCKPTIGTLSIGFTKSLVVDTLSTDITVFVDSLPVEY